MSNLEYTFNPADLLSFFTAGAALGVAYLFVVLLALWRFRRVDGRAAGRPEPVTVLRPLHGPEPGLADRLLAVCDQDYSAPIQIVFGCHDADDAAIPTVERLQDVIPKADIDLVVDGRVYGANRKISNLINMLSVAKHDVLIASDSDIDVDPTYVAKITAALDEPGVGAVTCLYHGLPGPGTAAGLSALAINAYFLPMVMMATTFGLARPCFGSTIATRRSTLERIGGMTAFVDKLADDYEIGAAVRSAGYEVAIPTFTVGHACNETTIAQFMRQHIRNARTIKTIDPFGHAGSFICIPFPLALIGLLQRTEAPAVLAVAAVLLRIAACKVMEVKVGLPRQKFWLLPLADILLAAAFVASFFGRTVMWRGRRYRVVPGGRLSPDRS
jgi:ceramide glucosyltransferase